MSIETTVIRGAIPQPVDRNRGAGGYPCPPWLATGLLSHFGYPLDGVADRSEAFLILPDLPPMSVEYA